MKRYISFPARVIKRRRYSFPRKRVPTWRYALRSPQVFKFKRTYRATTGWVPGTAAVSDYWKSLAWSLSGLPSASELTSLFDQYRITGIKVTVRPRYDSFAGNDTTDTTLPGVTNQGGNDIHVIIDPNNDLTPAGAYNTTTLNTFLENGNVQTFSGNRPFSVFVRPKVGLDVGGVASAQRSSQWIQTSQPGILHYGMQMFITDVGMTGNFGNSYDFFYTFYIECKGIR